MNTTNICSVSKIDLDVLSQFETFSLWSKETQNSIKDIGKTIDQLKELEQSLKEQEMKCNRELEELVEQQNSVQEEAELLKKRAKSLKLEYSNLEEECKIAERRMRPSSKDTQTLEKHKKKLKLYKNMIGLKWDYTAPVDHSVGYVFNSTTNKVKPFSFEGMNSSADKVWSEVKAIAKPEWDTIQ